MKHYLKMFNLIAIILFSSLYIKRINYYYSLPLKTSKDYKDPKEASKTAYNYLTNYIYTELNIGTPDQYLPELIRSKTYCSYIATYLCNIENSDYDYNKSSFF